MQYISATDAKQNMAAMVDAAQAAPVMIQRQNRDVAVVLSVSEFERLRGYNIDDFEAFCDKIGERAKERGLTEEKLAELLEDE